MKGTFIPEKGLVVAADGSQYPASCVPNVRRFFERKPEEAAKAKYLICWPRTSDTGRQVHLYVAKVPTDPEKQAALKREAGRFRVSGLVTNQRSRLNKVVVRVVRSFAVPKNRRKWTQFANHLVFLSGRAAPAAHFLNKHATFVCQLEGQKLQIRSIESSVEPEVEVLKAGGLNLPWPFLAGRKHVDLLCEFNKVGPGPFPQREDCRDRLDLRLRQFDLLIKARAGMDSPEEVVITDRIEKIRDRVRAFTRRMGDTELETLLEETGLSVALSKLNLEEPGAPPPVSSVAPTKSKAMPIATPTAAPALTKTLQSVDTMLRKGSPDALMAMAPGMNLKRVKASVSALMGTDGWWDSLAEEEQEKAQRASYQVRKALKLR